MKQHLYSMDVLRAFCAIQVFFLHYVAGINHRELIPLFCGAVPTFLLMSAYLYGMRGDSISYNLAFMKKRFFSLSTSYYPFILVTFLSYLFIDGYSDKLLQGFIVDFLYLGTIGADYNLPHCGHLWFLSILMLCYIALVVCSKIKLVKRTMTNRTGIISVFIIVALLGFVYRGALLIWLFFYLLVYYNAPKLLKIGGGKLPVFVSLFLIYCAMMLGMGNAYHLVYYSYALVSILGILTIILAEKYLSHLHPNKVVLFLSKISMEIYLVHHLFVYNLPLWESATITLVLSVALHYVSQKIKTKCGLLFGIKSKLEGN